jgi:hypothetical protein
MSEYRRPSLVVATYRDEAGLPINYGHRWAGSPPEDAYSRVSDSQRFAPLHVVADSLVEWLQANFDVKVEESLTVADDLLHSQSDIIRAVRVSPQDRAAAPLTFVLTKFPGVLLHAGALHDYHFPSCGCDACDDDIEDLAEQLEWTVRAVIAGDYLERLVRGDVWVFHRLEGTEGDTRSGQIRVSELPQEKVKRAHLVLPASGRWSAWEPRPLANGRQANDQTRRPVR